MKLWETVTTKTIIKSSDGCYRGTWECRCGADAVSATCDIYTGNPTYGCASIRRALTTGKAIVES